MSNEFDGKGLTIKQVIDVLARRLADQTERIDHLASIVIGGERPADPRDHALNQIQTIAYDGVLALEAGGLDHNATHAKFERIQNIAEAGAPDEDWRPAIEEERRAEEIAKSPVHGPSHRYGACGVTGCEDCRPTFVDGVPLPEAGDMSTSDGLGVEATNSGTVQAGFEAAQKIAAFLAEPGDLNGGDVCDVAATALIAAGLLTKEQCN